MARKWQRIQTVNFCYARAQVCQQHFLGVKTSKNRS